MKVLDYDTASLRDQRVVRILEQGYGKRLDPAYLAFIEHLTSGVPPRQYVAARATVHRIGRFLPLVDNYSELEPPFRRSWEFLARDVRIDWGVLTLIEEDGPSAWHLFGGERLLPFVALYRGSRHPDTLSLTGGDTNLLTFAYDKPGKAPRGGGLARATGPRGVRASVERRACRQPLRDRRAGPLRLVYRSRSDTLGRVPKPSC